MRKVIEKFPMFKDTKIGSVEKNSDLEKLHISFRIISSPAVVIVNVIILLF